MVMVSGCPYLFMPPKWLRSIRCTRIVRPRICANLQYLLVSFFYIICLVYLLKVTLPCFLYCGFSLYAVVEGDTHGHMF